MGGVKEQRGKWPRIDDAAKAAFLEAMRAGAPLKEAAAVHGVTLQAFREARKRDAAFDAAWREAHAASAEAERKRDEEGETRIVPNNRRGLQRRPLRRVKFDEERQQAFLAHFAQNCDTIAAAAEAGISAGTIYLERRRSPAFAAAFQEALDQGYVTLEAEAVRQRLDAQRRLRAAIDGAADGPGAIVTGDAAAEFERVLKLLERRDRHKRRPEHGAAAGSRKREWTFDAAIALLDRRLESLGVALPTLPGELAARYDGPAADEESSGGEDS